MISLGVIIIDIIVVLIVFCLFAFGFSILFGAPYVPTLQLNLAQLFAALPKTKKASFVDLGSGDGRMLKLAASKGYRAVGYEINPVLWLLSRLRLKRSARVHLANMFDADLGDSDVVFTFGISRIMPRLEAKLIKEMKPGSVFVSHAFELPHKKRADKVGPFFIYKF